MNKTLALGLISFIALPSCGECDDCVELLPVQYSLINQTQISLNCEFYWVGQFDSNVPTEVLNLELDSSDTSKFWTMSVNPVGYTDYQYVFASYTFQDSFDFEADSVVVKIDDGIIKTFKRDLDDINQDPSSIFFIGAYDSSEDNVLYYKLDSLKLDLK